MVCFGEPPSGNREFRKQWPVITSERCRASGLDYLKRSLALGLTLAAATQLAEGSRLQRTLR
jgi:hypothetical protein